MATYEMEAKLALIRKLRNERAELEDQIAALEDSVKAEMDSQGVSSMTVGTYSVKYTRFFRNYFENVISATFWFEIFVWDNVQRNTCV